MEQVKLKCCQWLNWSKKFYRICYNIVAFLSLGLLINLHLSVESAPLFQVVPLTKILAVLLLIAGSSIMVICICKYFAEMSGLYSKTAETLETTGLHRFVRHPLYFGTILFVIALTLLKPEVKNLVAFIVLLAYTRIGIHLEEKKLVTQFGDHYRSYRDKVPMLIPRPGRYLK